VDLRHLRQTVRFAHWSVCPSEVAPMTWGSVDLDDSVHRVCVCACVFILDVQTTKVTVQWYCTTTNQGFGRLSKHEVDVHCAEGACYATSPCTGTPTRTSTWICIRAWTQIDFNLDLDLGSDDLECHQDHSPVDAF